MTEVDTYRYDSIPKDTRSIRLLTLFSGNWEEDLKGSSQIVSLESAPEYDTISYVWGHESDDECMLLDGCKLQLRPNLESALRHLRNSDDPLLLWADAICINQQDIEERNHQVALMGDIYSRCSRVYMWLGLPVGNLDKDPYSIVRHFSQNKHIYDLPFVTSLPDSGYQIIEDLEDTKQGWSALTNSDWWKRLWCAQEALLPRDAILVFGKWRLPWQDLNDAWNNERTHRAGCCVEAAAVVPVQLQQAEVASLAVDRELFIKHDGDFTLDNVLRWCKYKQCQDPRDKVYGVLGIVDADERSNLFPDYSQSTEAVYVSTMKEIVSNAKDGDLDCLAGSGYNSKDLDIPSWVRDWSMDIDLEGVLHEHFRQSAYQLYDACRTLPSSRAQVVGSQLHPRGVKIAIIVKLGSPLHTNEDGYISTTIKEWCRIANIPIDTELSFAENPKQEAFWRTMIADTYVNQNYEPHRLSDPQESSEYAQHVSTLLQGWRHSNPSELDERFKQAILNAAHGRSMFVVDDGALGLCYPQAQVGDEVWVLCGGKVPFILRRDGQGGHRLIGDCYLEGYMDGQTLDDAQDRLVDITLV